MQLAGRTALISAGSRESGAALAGTTIDVRQDSADHGWLAGHRSCRAMSPPRMPPRPRPIMDGPPGIAHAALPAVTARHLPRPARRCVEQPPVALTVSARRLGAIPLQRVGTSDDIAEIEQFRISDGAGDLADRRIDVDGDPAVQ